MRCVCVWVGLAVAFETNKNNTSTLLERIYVTRTKHKCSMLYAYTFNDSKYSVVLLNSNILCAVVQQMVFALVLFIVFIILIHKACFVVVETTVK